MDLTQLEQQNGPRLRWRERVETDLSRRRPAGRRPGRAQNVASNARPRHRSGHREYRLRPGPQPGLAPVRPREGVIATRAGIPLERRLADIHARVGELLDAHRPDAMAIEELYFGANVRTAFAVGQARGVVLLAAGQRGVPSRSYTPQQVKAAVCGHGRADKDQVGRMVAAPAGPGGAADPRPRRRRAGGGDLRPQPGAAVAGRRWPPQPSRTPDMIALISGKVAVRRTDHVVVDCGGVGYRLAVSAETLKHVPAVGRPVTLHTHLVVRDDALALYGFATEEERDLFLMLLAVQSVGPKVALARPLRRAAPRAAGRRRRRRRGPAAVGARRRQADRRADRRRAAREGGGGAAGGGDLGRPRRRSRAPLAREALLGLGYTPAEIDDLLDGAPGDQHRGPDLPRAAERPPVSAPAPRIQDPEELPEDERELDRSLRPRRAGGLRRPGGDQGPAGGLDRRRRQPRRRARPRAAGRAARAGQDLAGPDRGRRARRPVRPDRRPGAGAQGRRRRVSDRAGAAVGVLRRRDPPPAARAGGDLLSRDGGRRVCRSPSARAPGPASSRCRCRRSR